jgi:hypothetical protein
MAISYLPLLLLLFGTSAYLDRLPYTEHCTPRTSHASRTRSRYTRSGPIPTHICTRQPRTATGLPFYARLHRTLAFGTPQHSTEVFQVSPRVYGCYINIAISLQLALGSLMLYCSVSTIVRLWPVVRGPSERLQLISEPYTLVRVTRHQGGHNTTINGFAFTGAFIFWSQSA